MRSPKNRDIVIVDHGSVILLEALTPRAHEWLVDHTQEDAQWFGEALAVEPRYVADIVNGAQDDGLVVRHGREVAMHDALNTIQNLAIRISCFADAAMDARDEGIRLALLSEIREKAIAIHDLIQKEG